MDQQHADTVPGFTMQSECFYLKFVTGLQCGVSSKLLEYETDWYEVMEILLSRLQDEPENKEQFETIASRDLEYWARIQPGGDTLNLKIRVNLEEKRYFLPPSGSRKTLRLVFNDRFSTQVLFHARKKMLLKTLRDLAAIAVADHFDKTEAIVKLETEIPRSLVPDVKKAFTNCWTPRFFRTKIVGCPPWCACKTWRKPIATLEAKVKRTTRRQLYKRVAGKAVSKKAQQKQTVKKVETKAKKVNIKEKKSVAKVPNKSNTVVEKANQKKISTKSKKVPVKCKQAIKSKKPTNLPNKSKIQLNGKKTAPPKSKVASQNSKSKAEEQVIKSNLKKPSLEVKGKKVQSTPNDKNQKKCVMKKKVVNVKVLKDKMKLMKNKLKSLLDTVTMKDKAILDIKDKLKSKKRKAEDPMDKVTPKRRSSRINFTPAQETIGSSRKKQKVDVKSKNVLKEQIFSPRPTRKSIKETNNKNIQRNQPKVISPKVKPTDKPSLPKSKKSSQKPKSKFTEFPAFKRTLRNQVHEAPAGKRRRQG
eukprot:GFUD01018894.1.p1 GENE.GFUD01018894.1~~GFUD01018894.1.p1  ORF type:complete len:531 (-),score=128.42 GFUD01018894.1:90-1682(-)